MHQTLLMLYRLFKIKGFDSIQNCLALMVEIISVVSAEWNHLYILFCGCDCPPLWKSISNRKAMIRDTKSLIGSQGVINCMC